MSQYSYQKSLSIIKESIDTHLLQLTYVRIEYAIGLVFNIIQNKMLDNRLYGFFLIKASHKVSLANSLKTKRVYKNRIKLALLRMQYTEPQDIKIKQLQSINKQSKRKLRLVKYYFDKFKKQTENIGL